MGAWKSGQSTCWKRLLPDWIARHNCVHGHRSRIPGRWLFGGILGCHLRGHRRVVDVVASCKSRRQLRRCFSVNNTHWLAKNSSALDFLVHSLGRNTFESLVVPSVSTCIAVVRPVLVELELDQPWAFTKWNVRLSGRPTKRPKLWLTRRQSERNFKLMQKPRRDCKLGNA